MEAMKSILLILLSQLLALIFFVCGSAQPEIEPSQIRKSHEDVGELIRFNKIFTTPNGCVLVYGYYNFPLGAGLRRQFFIKDCGEGWEYAAEMDACSLTVVHFVTDELGWGTCGWALVKLEGPAGRWRITTKRLPDNGIGSFLHGVYFLDPKTGWVSGAGQSIWRTLDGGEIWQRQVNLGEKKSTDFTEVRFFNDREGWAYGSDGTDVMFTSDKGKNWTSIMNRPPYPTRHARVFFSSLTHGCIFQWADEKFYCMFDGNEWQQIDVPDDFGGQLVFANDDVGWMAGNLLYKTNDGGKIWTKEPFGKAKLRWSVTVVDKLNVWASSEDQVWKTSTGGKDWQMVSQDWIPKLEKIFYELKAEFLKSRTPGPQ
jgi:photosystem II stability/assembly factor-like uncharacterized protein